tara:strand:- start:300 stop:401 length:102 start_codon:yes stop_codon:yes gene_type:complete
MKFHHWLAGLVGWLAVGSLGWFAGWVAGWLLAP